VLDLLVIGLTGWVMYYLRFDEYMSTGSYPLLLTIICFFTLNIFSWFSVYRVGQGRSLYGEQAKLALAWMFVALAVITFTFFTKTSVDYSRLWFGWTFIVSYLGFVSYRVLVHMLFSYQRRLGFNQKRVLIVGAGPLGKQACDAMLHDTWAGLVPVAFFDDDPLLLSQEYRGLPVAGSIGDVLTFIESRRLSDGNQAIDQVWIALPLLASSKIEQLQTDLLDSTANVYFLPDLFAFNLSSYKVDEIVGLPVVDMSATSLRGGHQIIKRIEDIIVSLLLILVLSPVFLITAALIKLEGAGPVFFKQRRYGLDGKNFYVWKFRSMTVMEEGAAFKQVCRNDHRVTKVGAWIRKLSIDELPQLFNVLNGSMSLIGPRPHPVAMNEDFRKKVRGYMSRHRIRPGITGWAQVNGCRGETAQLQDMERRIKYDLEYIRNWSILFDILIMIKTIKTVLNFKNTY